DRSVIVDGFFNVGRTATRGQSLGDQRIELGVLRLFHPMMPEQTFELRVESLVSANAVQVVALRHPFDVQNDENNPQRMVRQDGAGNLLRRSDSFAWRHETFLELGGEFLKQLDVFGFFACKPQQRSGPVIIGIELWTSMVQDERQNELFHETEGIKV